MVWVVGLGVGGSLPDTSSRLAAVWCLKKTHSSKVFGERGRVRKGVKERVKERVGERESERESHGETERKSESESERDTHEGHMSYGVQNVRRLMLGRQEGSACGGGLGVRD